MVLTWGLSRFLAQGWSPMRMPRVWRASLIAVPMFLAMLLGACTREVDLHSGLNEADANEVVVALSVAGIDAHKAAAKQGFNVSVAQGRLSEAVAALRAQGLPRSGFARMGDVFKKDGMISTPMEERGRYLYALSQELESTLSQIDGVVLARVHPVLPERTLPGEPATASSCAVFIKHRPDFDTAIYEERIRQLVLSSIPGLAEATRTKVSVVFAPAETSITHGGTNREVPLWQMLAIWGLGAVLLLCGVGAAVLAWPRLRLSWQRMRT
ncbi:type III secretion protein J [Variovorax boronicumulans]|uniref:type III secretion system inner membrane ring lipoprotein SctJ n=1 Tax=Variovorax boronicumulans TaxID=436515 RepID=UPI00278443F6|nr:type III secretion inner membrane ring lipoprotein SctJ [Variovorax boronicumulans]MDQ0083809.1 type III secretion protein J [Variovorax boronicumulans]